MATVQGVYLALFGRPADPAGLAYWNGVTKNGADLGAMLKELPVLPEYTSRFTGLTNEQVVNSIYQALYGRNADPTGLSFFVGQLQSGAQTLGTIAVNILDGAQGSDLARINAKLAASDLFTSHLDLPGEVQAYSGAAAADIGRNYISSITEANPGSGSNADAAIARLPGPSGGQGPGGVADDAGPNGSPVFTSAGTASVNENAPTIAVVYKATATDDNPGAVTYSLVGTDAGAFTIDPRTGEVRFVNSPDFETKASYSIGVKAQDTTGFASTKGVVITVNDVVENTTYTGATAGADVINKAGSLNNWTIDGLGGADTITGGLGNDTLIAGDSVTITPGAAGAKESYVFNFSVGSNGSGSVEVELAGFGGGGSSFSYTNQTSSTSIVNSLVSALNGINGYGATSQSLGNGNYRITVEGDNVGNLRDITVSESGGRTDYTFISRTQGSDATPTTYTNVDASTDVLTGGAGADTFVFAASTTNVMDRITDFNAGQGDRIDFANFGAAVYKGIFSPGGSSINTLITSAFGSLNAGEAGLFNFNSKQYVVFDANGNNTFEAGADQIIEVTGLTGTLSQANFI